MNFKVTFPLTIALAISISCTALFAGDAPKTKFNFTPAQLVNSPKKIAGLIGLAAFAYLNLKDEPTTNPMGFKDGVKGFFTKNPLSVAYVKHIAQFVDEVIIGYQGKERGFRVLGSKITYEGKPQSVAAIKQQLMNGAEEATLYKFKDAAPYGIMGRIWAKIKTITGGLKKVKDAAETLQWTHDVVINNC